MVLLEDETYADLHSRALRTDALEAEYARIKGEMAAEIARLKADIQTERARLEAGIAAAEAIAETPEEQERAFQLIRLQAENERLREKLGLAVRRMFGPRSERRISGQEAFLFNEVEAEEAPEAPEPLRQVKGHLRGKKRAGQRALDLGGLEIREVEYELPESERVCPLCSEPMRKMGENERIKVEIAPMVVTVTREKQAKYCCCNPDNHPMKTSIVAAPLPPTAFPKSLATPSGVAHIMHEKYVMGSPLYRQEQQVARQGFPLSRQTMANWVIAGADVLEPIWLRMQEHLLMQPILHADETKLQVLHEAGKPPTSQSFMWLYRTGRYSPPIVLYDYQPSRAREHPARFLSKFNGYLHVDGYSGYEKLPGITLSGCWSHARRKFMDAIAVLPAPKREKGNTKSHEGLAFCEKIFEIERDLHDVTPEERKAGRQARSRPVVEAFRKWLDAAVIDALPKTPLGLAVRYCIQQWSKLIAFLEDGRLEIDNNRAERSIKPFVTGRKNWLFSNTEAGADASATVYSIVETAKENNLDPRTYLQYLFEQLALLKKPSAKQLDDLLPWMPQAQAACRIPQPLSE